MIGDFRIQAALDDLFLVEVATEGEDINLLLVAAARKAMVQTVSPMHPRLDRKPHVNLKLRLRRMDVVDLIHQLNEVLGKEMP